MLRKKTAPRWSEEPPASGSFRSIFKYGCPHEFKHPSRKWFDMMKEEFSMTDHDFLSRKLEGRETVSPGRPSTLDQKHRRRFEAIVGELNVSADDYSRVKYSTGKSTEEVMELRRHEVGPLADLVVHPRTKQEVREIVAYCNDHGIPVFAYGAGSSVTLGIRPRKGGISLVMSTHMNRVLEVNELNQSARVQPGIYGPAYEEALRRAPELFSAKRRYTCGHFPQSFEYSTVGGWIVTLGSGQASTYYGDACDLVISQEYVTPSGTIRTLDYPATATGPKVNDIMKGSEGAFGILVEATLKIHRYMPGNTKYFSFMLPTWEAAVNAAREVSQGEFGLPAVFRISDPEETERGLKLYGMPSFVDIFLKKRGFHPGKRCLCLGSTEGERAFAGHVRKMVKKTCRDAGAISLGGYAGKKWEHTRFKEPYMREDLMDYGILIDTLECSVTWDTLHAVHQGVRYYMTARPRTMCMTHASHFYPQGTNLYFIFLARMDDMNEYRQFQRGIIDQIQKHGGSLSHHHGIGRMMGPWMERHLGHEQMEVLRALKRHFDPKNIMNPGGLLGLDRE